MVRWLTTNTTRCVKWATKINTTDIKWTECSNSVWWQFPHDLRQELRLAPKAANARTICSAASFLRINQPYLFSQQTYKCSRASVTICNVQVWHVGLKKRWALWQQQRETLRSFMWDEKDFIFWCTHLGSGITTTANADLRDSIETTSTGTETCRLTGQSISASSKNDGPANQMEAVSSSTSHPRDTMSTGFTFVGTYRQITYPRPLSNLWNSVFVPKGTQHDHTQQIKQ